jgi:hypothetical protein
MTNGTNTARSNQIKPNQTCQTRTRAEMARNTPILSEMLMLSSILFPSRAGLGNYWLCERQFIPAASTL